MGASYSVTQRQTIDRDGPFGDEEGRDWLNGALNPVPAIKQTDKWFEYKSPYQDKGSRYLPDGKAPTWWQDPSEPLMQASPEEYLERFERSEFLDIEQLDEMFMGPNSGIDERGLWLKGEFDGYSYFKDEIPDTLQLEFDERVRAYKAQKEAELTVQTVAQDQPREPARARSRQTPHDVTAQRHGGKPAAACT
eukprot:CAMPEP_0119189610 /NCGR_PEP_ID=MMETSP1316-20130426/889_1 /TAXON_ID=41880 /ORGANISM="Pycnococcus provasolii, Strain RCC2336" /LENGTH=192 /DNA_ID=CAMNT_0007184281 /DNA_START=53 /DNA_END=632 /DNA_ORIENTATION=+